MVATVMVVLASLSGDEGEIKPGDGKGGEEEHNKRQRSADRRSESPPVELRSLSRCLRQRLVKQEERHGIKEIQLA